MRSYVAIAFSTFSGVICIALAALGSVSAQQVLKQLDAADAIYQDFPPKETLPPEELAVVLETWDAAVLANDLRAISNAIHFVTRGVPRPYRLRGAHVLRYDNPEIEERLIELYLSEMERYALTVETELTFQDVGLGEDVVRGEGHMDYLDGLVGPAQYTFSPRIYDAVLKGYWGTTSRLTYLATVNPEKVLQLLLDAQLREPTRIYGATDLLDLPDGLATFGVARAFKLLSLLCERSSEVVLEERERVLDFVRTRALHYVKPVERRNKRQPVYRNVLDYRTRILALKSLELLAQSADVYSIVDAIVRNPPDNGAPGPNEITTEGLRLIEQIRALK